MNKKSLYKAFAVAAVSLSGVALTSCNDFLEIIPMNDVVLENYWTEKKDATNALFGCYESLVSNDNMVRMGLWGEVRSDNLKLGTNPSLELQQLVKENILPTNSFCKWASFYATINRCNVFCYYAPQVQSKDPNYTEAEMKQNIAEAVAIRTLCYFYLMRTFRDVPYTKEASIDDTQNYQLPATKFDELLDILIADLEAVKDDAARRYAADFNGSAVNDNAQENTSRITRYAIYALLADLYLWKGDWDNCIKYCDLVIDYKKEYYKNWVSAVGTVNDVAEFAGCPLYMECPSGSTTSGNVATKVFGKGNSYESIFELYFEQNKGAENQYVGKYFYDRNNSNDMGYLSVPTTIYGELPTTTSEVFKTKTDCRAYANINKISESNNTVAKYFNQSVSFNTINVTKDNLNLSRTRRGDNYANWIVYRLSEMLLMKAEALTEKGGDANLDAAYTLANAVFRRANCIMTESGGLTKPSAGDQDAMRNLVFDERQREFMFEGKRWFDLIRYTRRKNNNTDYLAEKVVKKQTTDQSAIKIRLADPNMIYYPYFRDELKVNPNLHQNPAYSNGTEDNLNKN